ncbi:MAG: glycoside hydrolase family 88 protein [Bacteroidota bacterium]|nr:glycoside hydrolase family 88 protein [Bacteroidota bacterium]
MDSPASFARKPVPCSLTKDRVIELIKQVNYTYQNTTPFKSNAFWNNAAYHTGNMEAYKLTGLEDFKIYSENWAKYNQWKGATSNDTAIWKYTYGETNQYVLFGDWQACFQTYVDLYNLDAVKDSQKIVRARGVMEYEMSTSRNDYWWWSDGLYMAMPVMTKLYKVTGNELYLQKLKAYFLFADQLMFDKEYHLYYRDAKYVYPKQPTINGKKNFWSRGNGWVFAAFAKVLEDIPENHPLHSLFVKRFKGMAKTLKATQQPEGYWTRTILDAQHAPGRETSGTAFFTYGLFWGINHGYLKKSTYLPAAMKGWNYLQNIALQTDHTIGYVQPIGENASPDTTISATSTANFGVGAWLLAACEVTRYLDK